MVLFSSRRRHTRYWRDWSSDVCSSDLGWRPVVLGLGLATMLVGGYRALRQNDLKLLLAFGTVSQLGFLLVLVGGGSRELAAAGLAMTVAHALFKSTL